MKTCLAALVVSVLGWLLVGCGGSETNVPLDAARACLESEGFTVTVNTDTPQLPRLFVRTPSGSPTTTDQGGASEVEVTLHEASATVDFYPTADRAEVFGGALAGGIHPKLPPVQTIGSVVVYWPAPVPESEQDAVADCVTA